ncbi:MAG: PspA/IM30 family protein, partial [Oscillospiraceae bacterium]|nr:PspA/IM30 family protein [Oscillospiraceae bacterium]
LQQRRANIKATVAVAKTQERINDATASANSAKGSLAAFDRMKEKAQEMLDKANAEAELNGAVDAATTSLEDKYGAGSVTSVDDELSALKAELGL